jgi:hypothetical protein
MRLAFEGAMRPDRRSVGRLVSALKHSASDKLADRHDIDQAAGASAARRILPARLSPDAGRGYPNR